MSTVVIMAGGTGGHIYPALAVGTELRARGVNVYWMGVRSGLEDQLARSAGFEFDAIRIRGVWGAGLLRWLTLPLWLAVSVWQSLSIILHRRPDLMLGMGGYVCGPGGLAAALLKCPLIVHESNAIAGMTNKILSRVAVYVLTGVEDSDLKRNTRYTGTPVRNEIIAVARDKVPAQKKPTEPLNLLVIGGSQGAQALNQTLPAVLKDQPSGQCPNVLHQAGKGWASEVHEVYAATGIEAEVREYIDDMPSAYRWADIVVARAGAMTIAEISTVGLAAILVPYPHAARDHQRANARVLERTASAIVCLQGEGFKDRLRAQLNKLTGDRALIGELSDRIRSHARPDATAAVVACCMEVLER